MLFNPVIYLGLIATGVFGQDSGTDTTTTNNDTSSVASEYITSSSESTSSSISITDLPSSQVGDATDLSSSDTDAQTTTTAYTLDQSSSSYSSSSYTSILNLTSTPPITSTTTQTTEEVGDSTADLGPGPTTNPTTNPGMTNTAAPTSTPPPFYILPSKDSDKCLGVFDSSGNKDTSVRLKECEGSGNETLWILQTTVPTQVISLAFPGEKWCLDAGGMDDASGPVFINRCDPHGTPGQFWQWTIDAHLVVANQSRGLDLENGSVVGGGYIQTWPYVYNNTNQEWFLQTSQTQQAQIYQSG